MILGLEHLEFATRFVSTDREPEKMAEFGTRFMEAVEGAVQEAS